MERKAYKLETLTVFQYPNEDSYTCDYYIHDQKNNPIAFFKPSDDYSDQDVVKQITSKYFYSFFIPQIDIITGYDKLTEMGLAQ